jgi:hypothetical protein
VLFRSIAEHTIGGLAAYACGDKKDEKILDQAVAHVQRMMPLSPSIANSQAALAAHHVNMEPLRVKVPARSKGASKLAEGVSVGVPPIPIYPIVSGKTPTAFTPQPIPITRVGIETWPRMDAPDAKKYYHWDRYQSTWNGQPNATYPKVGW